MLFSRSLLLPAVIEENLISIIIIAAVLIVLAVVITVAAVRHRRNKKNTAQESPFCPLARRVTKVLSPWKMAFIRRMLLSRSVENVICSIVSPLSRGILRALAGIYAPFRSSASVCPNRRMAASASGMVLPDEPTSISMEPGLACWLKRWVRRLTGRISPG